MSESCTLKSAVEMAPGAASGMGPTSAKRSSVDPISFRRLNVGPGPAIYGRSPTGSHGHLNVGSAPDKGPSRADDVGRVVGLCCHSDGPGSTSAIRRTADDGGIKQLDGRFLH
jgi:hypothetical protein